MSRFFYTYTMFQIPEYPEAWFLCKIFIFICAHARYDKHAHIMLRLHIDRKKVSYAGEIWDLTWISEVCTLSYCFLFPMHHCRHHDCSLIPVVPKNLIGSFSVHRQRRIVIWTCRSTEEGMLNQFLCNIQKLAYFYILFFQFAWTHVTRGASGILFLSLRSSRFVLPFPLLLWS